MEKELRASLERAVEERIKGFELEGVEITEEDYEDMEKGIQSGKSLECSVEDVLQGIRDTLDEGLDELEGE